MSTTSARRKIPASTRAPIEDPYKIAGDAVELARQHGTPPEPETFRVWYTYASGKSAVLNERIEALIADGSPSAYEITNLCDEVIEGNQGSSHLQTQANESLQSEMADVQRFIQSYMHSTEQFQGAMDTSSRSLNEASSAADVEVIIALMIRENQRIRSQTKQLSNSLQETQNEIVRLQKRLKKSQQAEQQDPMTGLPNRRFFQNAIATAIAQAEAGQGQLSFSIADIDHFKAVNDTFGHQIGDEILKFVGTFISQKLGDNGTVSRYGGEEFAIIMPDIEIEEARLILGQIKEGLASAKLVTSKTRKPIGSITVSFGLSERIDGDTIETLFERADEKLYEAKKAGRNRVM